VVNDKVVEELLKADTTLCSIDEKIDTSFSFALRMWWMKLFMAKSQIIV
jgi:hypothetical protein